MEIRNKKVRNPKIEMWIYESRWIQQNQKYGKIWKYSENPNMQKNRNMNSTQFGIHIIISSYPSYHHIIYVFINWFR